MLLLDAGHFSRLNLFDTVMPRHISAPLARHNRPYRNQRRARRDNSRRTQDLERVLASIDSKIADAQETGVILKAELAQWKKRADDLEKQVIAKAIARGTA
ncbi:hypothetical protein CYLTODRAFT_450316 [Cylindrobasidium torrendii FP15055 ss-10]|uniref:Uncharacterized protein n=1 Tax=Cylindrobasidium torrendii FP15055 ss-10 TaxID=1314674 RepID=A0A0D7BNE2_9AGAR|nr:hypothetical protein CYLTODRAFT_450316 [Cylindrobasidium torrendii FP15055 ss-10]